MEAGELKAAPLPAPGHATGLAPVAFHFDFISPFAYLASTQIDALAARHGRTVDWQPVLVGVLVNQVMKMTSPPELPLKGPYLQRDVLRLAEWLGVPFAFHGLSGVNSVLALRVFLLLKAQDPARAHAWARQVFERLWVRGLDITAAADLKPTLAPWGVDAEVVLEAATLPPAKQMLRLAVDDAVAQGVFGVPFFRVDGEALWGVDRLDMLAHWLAHRRWSRGPILTQELTT